MYYIWDNRRPRGQDEVLFIQSDLDKFEIESFLRDVFSMGKIVAASEHVYFYESDFKLTLGQVIPKEKLTPRLNDPSFYTRHVRALKEWNKCSM